MVRQVINPPSISGFTYVFLKGMIGVAVLAVAFTFFSSGFSGLTSGSELAKAVLLLGGIWMLVLGLQSLYEPMLIREQDALVVRRWGSQLLHIGEGQRYPLQVLRPMEVVVTGARGGRSRVVQLSLQDYSGYQHRVRFFFVTLAGFQSASANWFPLERSDSGER